MTESDVGWPRAQGKKNRKNSENKRRRNRRQELKDKEDSDSEARRDGGRASASTYITHRPRLAANLRTCGTRRRD